MASIFEKIESRKSTVLAVPGPQGMVRRAPGGLWQKFTGRLFPRVTIDPTWIMGRNDPVYESYVTEGFAGNALIYAAIMYKARATVSAPPRAFIGDEEDLTPAPADHPLNELLVNPSPTLSSLEWIQLITGYFNIAGNAFIWLARDDVEGELPESMYPLRPDRVRIIPDENGQEIKGYIYNATGNEKDTIPILAQDMMHIKMPNLMDRFAGMGKGQSPVTPMAKSGDVDNKMTSYLMDFFERGAMTNGLLTTKEWLSDDHIQATKRRWQEQYGGSEKWPQVGVLPGEWDYKPLSMNFDEMGFESIDKRNEARILMAFGVPPILVGSLVGLERATYSNYEEAREAFWIDTLDPELKLFEAEFDRFLKPSDGAVIRFDRREAPAFQNDVLEQSQAAREMHNSGVPWYIAAQTVGLKMERFEGDDISYLTIGNSSVSTPAADLSPDDDEPAETDDDAG